MRAVAVLVFAGCAQGFTQAPRPDAAPSELGGHALAIPGEAMEYRVALRGITVGHVEVAVGQPGWLDGRRAIVVRSRGTSAGVVSLIGDLRWELTTSVDLASGRPIHEIEESWLQVDGEPEHHRAERDWAERSGFDLHAAAAALRGWRAGEGERATSEVTIDGATLEIELWEAAREYLAAAHQPAVRYDGTARGKYHFRVWISDDEARVPLLLETDTRWGGVTVELVRYDPPSDP
jgi:hypothetical protein